MHALAIMACSAAGAVTGLGLGAYFGQTGGDFDIGPVLYGLTWAAFGGVIGAGVGAVMFA